MSDRRYTQSDPIGLAGGINTYVYANGNPVSIVDPDGKLGTVIVGAIGGFTFDVFSQLTQNGGNFGAINWGTVAVSTGNGALAGLAPAALFGKAALKLGAINTAVLSLITGTLAYVGGVSNGCVSK